MPRIGKETTSTNADWQVVPEILLSGLIPPPMWGTAPRVVLGDTWWNRERKRAYASTKNHCITCGVHKSQAKCFKHLEGHETYSIDWFSGTMLYLKTVPVCHYCHNYIHLGRLYTLLENGSITQRKYLAITKHGEDLLARYKLKRKEIPTDYAPWGEWRLVVDGKEYPPCYNSLEEFQSSYK